MFGKRVSGVVPIISCLNGHFSDGHFVFAVVFWRVLGTELRGLIRSFEISHVSWNILLWNLMSGMGCFGAELVPFSKRILA